MSTNPQLGDVAIHTYRYKGDAYREYVMFRRDRVNHMIVDWFNGQGERIPSDRIPSGKVQPLPSAMHLHARLDFPDPTAYTPKPGDVATYAPGSGVPVTVMYRALNTKPGWYTHTGMRIDEVEIDSTFRLILRDGQLQTDAD